MTHLSKDYVGRVPFFGTCGLHLAERLLDLRSGTAAQGKAVEGFVVGTSDFSSQKLQDLYA